MYQHGWNTALKKNDSSLNSQRLFTLFNNDSILNNVFDVRLLVFKVEGIACAQSESGVVISPKISVVVHPLIFTDISGAL